MSWLTNAGAAFSIIAWKTLRVSTQRPQAPPDIYKKVHSFENKEEGLDLMEAMENAHSGFEEAQSLRKVLSPQGGWGVSHSLAPRHKRARVCS